MLNTNALLLPAAASPQDHLVAYEELTLLRSSRVPAAIWRSCAANLRASLGDVPNAFRGKYAAAIANCDLQAMEMDACFGKQAVLSVDIAGIERAVSRAQAVRS